MEVSRKIQLFSFKGGISLDASSGHELCWNLIGYGIGMGKLLAPIQIFLSELFMAAGW